MLRIAFSPKKGLSFRIGRRSGDFHEPSAGLLVAHHGSADEVLVGSGLHQFDRLVTDDRVGVGTEAALLPIGDREAGIGVGDLERRYQAGNDPAGVGAGLDLRAPTALGRLDLGAAQQELRSVGGQLELAALHAAHLLDASDAGAPLDLLVGGIGEARGHVGRCVGQLALLAHAALGGGDQHELGRLHDLVVEVVGVGDDGHGRGRVEGGCHRLLREAGDGVQGEGEQDGDGGNAHRDSSVFRAPLGTLGFQGAPDGHPPVVGAPQAARVESVLH